MFLWRDCINNMSNCKVVFCTENLWRQNKYLWEVLWLGESLCKIVSVWFWSYPKVSKSVFIRFLSHYYASCSEKCISNSVTDYNFQQCEWSVTERGAADVFRLSPERYFYHFLRYCQKRDRDRYTTDDKRTCGIGVQTKHIFSRPHSCSCSKLKLLDQPTFTLNKVHLYRYLFMFFSSYIFFSNTLKSFVMYIYVIIRPFNINCSFHWLKISAPAVQDSAKSACVFTSSWHQGGQTVACQRRPEAPGRARGHRNHKNPNSGKAEQQLSPLLGPCRRRNRHASWIHPASWIPVTFKTVTFSWFVHTD